MSTSSEKSTFSQTCNLLSRYIKHNGNSGNITNVVTPKNLTTMDFLTPMSMVKEPKGKAAQLTMFYNGQVIVLDDFPAEKVEELKSFAKTQTPTQSLVTPVPKLPCGTIVVDMPIARKASLLRFMEKRKNRVAAKSPYYKTITTVSDPVKASESIPWLVLGAKST
ncbi:unnamed protein product [Vicia faba]|uniref:Protein TIFY n=1 Tax=Vicia faba TaxID=3906 RepID=A0AAV1AK91_VICFA|nr:unnamed protein product [Vicia faba]